MVTKLLQPAIGLISLTILLNISWTLVEGNLRDLVTIAAVITFALASSLHAIQNFGLRWFATFAAIVVLTSFAIELVGVHTGLIFGDYEYSERLGWMIGQVPLLIPLAWLMMMYPSLLLGWELGRSRFLFAPILSAWTMASWDLFLDPQMVGEGYWVWFDANGNSTQEIPISNFVGWFVVTLVIAIAVPNPQKTTNKTLFPTDFWDYPTIAICWVWLGSTLANVVTFAPFLARPEVALQGFIGMALAVVPWLKKMRNSTPVASATP